MKYTISSFERDIKILATRILEYYGDYSTIFGVPRGGIPVTIALFNHLVGFQLVDKPRRGTIVVDDVVDSGATRRRYEKFPFLSLHSKRGCCPPPSWAVEENIPPSAWIEYWWEGSSTGSGEDIILRSLQYIGEDVHRPGLEGTPGRVLRSWGELFSGYRQDPKDHLTTFTTHEYSFDQMILLRDIEMYSMCEHHMLPFFGKAHVAYIPGSGNMIIGVSKMARILDVFARRLQIQERIGEQVTTFLMENLKPVGAACVIEADHLCMRMRGVEKQNSILTTSSLKGIFLEDSEKGRSARMELMRLIR